MILLNITKISDNTKQYNKAKINYYKGLPDFYTLNGPIYPIKNKNFTFNEYTRPFSNNIVNNKLENITQIGTLISHNNDIYPLFGKLNKKYTSKWNYFTKDQFGTVIPLQYNNKNSNDDIGCDQLYNGDFIFIQEFRDRFRVNII